MGGTADTVEEGPFTEEGSEGSEGEQPREYSLRPRRTLQRPDYYQAPLRAITLVHDANWERFVRDAIDFNCNLWKGV